MYSDTVKPSRIIAEMRGGVGESWPCHLAPV